LERRHPMRKVYVGLDVGSSGCEVAAMDGAGVVIARHSFMTSEKNLITVFEAMKIIKNRGL
jgi:N-acetylglucosamine kinase-like BadF-type ATPase